MGPVGIFVGVVIGLMVLFGLLLYLSSRIDPDEAKREGEKWWSGGE